MVKRIFFMLVLVCVSCQFRVERDPNVMVRYFNSDPQSLNPITGTDVYSLVANQFVMETLLEQDNTTRKMIPKLAARWDESPDHLQYTFFLRTDVRWHDDHPFTAADVVYSFNAINDPKVGAGHLKSYYLKAGIVEAIALDDHTVRFRLERPYFLALDFLGGMPIVAKHVFDDGTPFRGHPANRHPIGTGPLRFVEWVSGRHITLTRHEAYWGRPLQFTGMVYRIIFDQGVAFQALKKGQVDYAGVRPIQWARQTDSPKFLERFIKYAYLPETAGYAYIGWNMRHPVLQERAVRQALTMLTPRDQILKALQFGQGQVTTGPFYPLGPQHDASVPAWPYDPKRAKRLLREAGWVDSDHDGIREKNGKPLHITFVYPGPHRLYDALGNILREDLAKAGIHADVQSMEWTVFLKTIDEKKFDAYFGAWGGGGFEMDPHQVWHSSQIEDGSNYVQFASAEVDALIDRARQEFDPPTRHALYQRMHRILHDEQPYTFLFVSPALAVRHHRFTNVTVYPNGPDLAEWGVGPSEALVQ